MSRVHDSGIVLQTHKAWEVEAPVFSLMLDICHYCHTVIHCEHWSLAHTTTLWCKVKSFMNTIHLYFAGHDYFWHLSFFWGYIPWSWKPLIMLWWQGFPYQSTLSLIQKGEIEYPLIGYFSTSIEKGQNHGNMLTWQRYSYLYCSMFSTSNWLFHGKIDVLERSFKCSTGKISFTNWLSLLINSN